MTDHYDTIIAQMQDSLAGAKLLAETNWIFEGDVASLEREIAALQAEAAAWRALTPEAQAAIIAEREAKWAAFEEAHADDDTDDEED